MKALTLTTFALALTATPIALHGSPARAQSSVTADPASTYGWVFVEAGNIARSNINVPVGSLGGFDTTRLPSTVRGPNVTSAVRIAQIASDTPVNVRLERATLTLRGPQTPRRTGEIPRQRGIFLELDFSVPTSANLPSGKQIPVRLTLENANSGARMSFYVVVQVR
jgi:hypothetical protein